MRACMGGWVRACMRARVRACVRVSYEINLTRSQSFHKQVLEANFLVFFNVMSARPHNIQLFINVIIGFST